MSIIDSLSEKHILAAMRQGEFENLPGRGKPLVLDDDSAIPETLRAAYRILKNAGCLPPEQQLRSDIVELESLLQCVETDAEEQRIRRRLCLLRTRLAICGRDVNLLVEEGAYRERLLRRIAGLT